MMIRNFINKLFNLNKVSETKEGTVKFFNAKKGFGFITLKDSKDEIFVHTTNVVGKIREKNKVTFNIEKGKKGLVATNVRVIK
ncbi:cold-shock protein [Winogradskyella psychrotolerans]|uniref:cold-shock protein n=1 Tax=Winogradskyella psychrotolerans TaxID=1344585 RepID=UPI001C064F94|nr:cold shock domain-containing protein [Winogradskyella psychrotolerans]MBU2929339.1 cold shock domain-containing protein [Winogradskyella psychrotolerans]